MTSDPAGQLASQAHRHVLAHLPLPKDNYGWTLGALHQRMLSEPVTLPQSSLQAILADLQGDGWAEQIGGAWRQTASGFELLTGPVAEECLRPPGPVLINVGAATPLEVI